MAAKKRSKPVWEKARPKSLGKPKKLTPAQLQKIKAIVAETRRRAGV